MKLSHITDAIGELPEELIAPTAVLRMKKRHTWVRWTALAACLCLVVFSGLSWDGWRAASKNDGYYSAESAFDPLLDREDSVQDNKGSAGTTADTFMATVLEVHDTYIMVCPLDGEWELTSADKIEVSLLELQQRPELSAGDTVEIFYSGVLQELYPARAVGVKAVVIVE